MSKLSIQKKLMPQEMLANKKDLFHIDISFDETEKSTLRRYKNFLIQLGRAV